MISALFANSSISGGRENGYVSRRLVIWRDTDPDRCGLIPWVFDPDFGYERYLQWALDVPMFFLIRDHAYHAAGGLTFRQFMERGFEVDGQVLRPTVRDWDMHLTTLFPDVRLKRIIEVRGADTVPRAHICALPAVWKGLLYDADALDGTLSLLSGVSTEVLDAGQLDVARRGLRAEMGKHKVRDLARELVALRTVGSDGSTRTASATPTSGASSIRSASRSKGMSPGEEIARRWKDEWNGDRQKLIEATRY